MVQFLSKWGYAMKTVKDAIHDLRNTPMPADGKEFHDRMIEVVEALAQHGPLCGCATCWTLATTPAPAPIVDWKRAADVFETTIHAAMGDRGRPVHGEVAEARAFITAMRAEVHPGKQIFHERRAAEAVSRALTEILECIYAPAPARLDLRFPPVVLIKARAALDTAEALLGARGPVQPDQVHQSGGDLVMARAEARSAVTRADAMAQDCRTMLVEERAHVEILSDERDALRAELAEVQQERNQREVQVERYRTAATELRKVQHPGCTAADCPTIAILDRAEGKPRR